MKTKFWIGVVALMVAGSLHAQDYKVAKNTGKLVIKEVNNVQIEGYNGNEIVFTSLNYSADRDERAKGLKAISSMGLEDNTGIGLSVVDKGATIEVYQLKKMDGPKIKIMIPKGVSISYSHSSPYGSDIKLKNVESEIEISTVHNGVYLDNVTGPMDVRTVHGEVEVTFSGTIKSPVSIVSTHGLIDISIPSTTKANLDMSTNYGEILVDPSLNVEVENRGDWKVYGSNKVKGKINGGGLDIILSSKHSSIYLRKK
jgi:predicted membrane protein